MASRLKDKKIILGITGSIAAYKAAELIRRLRDEGAIVRVVMTASAKAFITPLTMQALSGHPVQSELLDADSEAAMEHISLAKWADFILIAPASANAIARLAHGFADDLLTALCLASTAKIAVVPAMNQQMWRNSLTQVNVKKLQDHHISIFGPDEGSQACGDVGFGRMLTPEQIIDQLISESSEKYFSQCQLIITAGPTHEALDPVRYLTNKSSGKMGYALARAAVAAGAKVILITGPTHLATPIGAKIIAVTTAQEMYDAVMQSISSCDIYISTAAIADYRSQQIAQQKIKKNEATLKVSLIKNPDILKAVTALTKRPYTVGFAAETETLAIHAKQKLIHKNLDMIVANLVADNLAFDRDDNELMVIKRNLEQIDLPRADKYVLSRQLLQIIYNDWVKIHEFADT